MTGLPKFWDMEIESLLIGFLAGVEFMVLCAGVVYAQASLGRHQRIRLAKRQMAS